MESLVDTPLDSEAIQWAIDGAKTAVTTVKGTGLCGDHLLGYMLTNVVGVTDRRRP